MTTLKIPRAHQPFIKSLQSLEEVNVWASGADASIVDIISSLRRVGRDLTVLMNKTGIGGVISGAALFDGGVPAYRSGTGVPGSASTVAHRDHVHPTDYAIASLSASQITDIAVGDHVKWNQTDALSGVTLDTTTAYTSAAGASIGRFTLSAGKTYRLRAKLKGTFSGATGRLEYQWATDSGATVGRGALALTVTSASNEGDQQEAIAIVTPASNTLYEVRLTAVTALSLIGLNNSFALVETL